MSPEKQNIAIAEFCGWTGIQFDRNGGIPPNGEHFATLTNYVEDANERRRMLEILGDMRFEKLCDMILDGRPNFGYYPFFRIMNIKQSEFAEIFIRAIGKWEDS